VGVVETAVEDAVPGGAGNVASNLRALQCEVCLCGVVGEDAEGRVLLETLRERAIPEEGIFKTGDRPTTVKTRVMVRGQQVIRLDRESKSEIPENVEEGILRFVEANMSLFDGVLLSDYAKGVLTDRLTPSLIQIARDSCKPVIVDPKGSDFTKYAGANLLKPNLQEAGVVVGMQISNKDSLIRAGSILLEKLNSDAILITKGKDGMTLFDRRNGVVDIPIMAREVYDITGAGDTVLSVLGMILCSGFDHISAAKIANVAAGIVVGKVGTAVVTRDEI
jgi:D-beta-D-heptose 7-phosphate kinase/D-beta-D-heptose 1-phosphate adenosyltransferase